MTLQRKIGFWLSAFAIFAAVVWILRDVLMPFAAGMVLAYLFDPLADRLEKLGLGRLGASLLILISFVVLFVLLLIVVLPLLGTQIVAFIEKAPSYVARLQALVIEQGGTLLQKAGGEKVLDDLQTSLGEIMGQAMSWLGRFLTSIWSGGQAILGIASLMVVTPVVAFYILLDWDRMIAKVDSWIPLNQRDTVRQLMREIDQTISRFLVGQALVCIILGGIYAVGLMLVGLNFGLLIGVSAGLLSFIPYVGSMLGLIVSVGVAFAQYWPDWTMIGLVVLVFGIGQFIEGYILSPKLVGESVGLHPVWLMFALIAAGSLFGFLGLLIAVPVSAAIGVLVRFAIRQYLASPLYSGRSGLATESGDASAASDG